MPDFPSAAFFNRPIGSVIHSCSAQSGCVSQGIINIVNFGAAAWPAANRAIYIPFYVEHHVTARQMFWENGGVAGTTDIGIYDVRGKRLISSTATTNSGSIQIVNITDTDLDPGIYYMGADASTVTTQTYWSGIIQIPNLRMCGVQQEAVGSATLPAQATFAAVTSAYLPMLGICFEALM